MRSFGFKKRRGEKKVYIPHVATTEIECWFDGACWPNPNGHAACGAVIKHKGVTIANLNKYLGEEFTSNNFAEYEGLLLILNWLCENKIEYATIYGDSDLVINQMIGRWKAREKGKPKAYMGSYKRACEVRASLPNVRYYWIPRDYNEEADLQSRIPLIARGIRNPFETGIDADFERVTADAGRPNIRVIKKFKK